MSLLPMEIISPLCSSKLMQHCFMGAENLFPLPPAPGHQSYGSSHPCWAQTTACSRWGGLFENPDHRRRWGLGTEQLLSDSKQQRNAVWQDSELIWYKAFQCKWRNEIIWYRSNILPPAQGKTEYLFWKMKIGIGITSPCGKAIDRKFLSWSCKRLRGCQPRDCHRDSKLVYAHTYWQHYPAPLSQAFYCWPFLLEVLPTSAAGFQSCIKEYSGLHAFLPGKKWDDIESI